MEEYFFDGKFDEIDLVPTTASHYDKDRDSAAKRRKDRASSAKYKDPACEPKFKLERQVGSALQGSVVQGRCKTSCKLAKKNGKK